MKRLLVIPAVIVVLAACGEHAVPGSSLAARLMAAEYVGKAYGVDPVRVNEEPLVFGDSAKVTALYQDQMCNLELVKSVGANEYGWLTKTIRCGKAV